MADERKTDFTKLIMDNILPLAIVGMMTYLITSSNKHGELLATLVERSGNQSKAQDQEILERRSTDKALQDQISAHDARLLELEKSRK